MHRFRGDVAHGLLAAPLKLGKALNFFRFLAKFRPYLAAQMASQVVEILRPPGQFFALPSVLHTLVDRLPLAVECWGLGRGRTG